MADSQSDEIVQALDGRATALSPPEMLRLDQWAESLTWTFQDGVFLVGSALTRRDPRDVDVRCRIPDDHPLLADPNVPRIVNVALSVWAQQSTGLNVDFQFQSISEFAVHVEAGKPRNPLGGRWRTCVMSPRDRCSCGWLDSGHPEIVEQILATRDPDCPVHRASAVPVTSVSDERWTPEMMAEALRPLLPNEDQS